MFNKNLISSSEINKRIELIAESIPEFYRDSILNNKKISKELFYEKLREIVNPDKAKKISPTLAVTSVIHIMELFI